ncbi:MAG TPA: alpha/beta fold hydrolase, partial [Spirochaetota bacterium]|nr:alpha/beta fold hydrolase [Spirochaetota bacterium]
MPVIKSEYTAPFGFGNRHIQTIFPTLFRRVKPVDFTRYRHETADGDFFDADCAFGNGDRVIILVHGLEGDSRRKYMRGMARAFAGKGFDAVSLNLRGCSGELNRLPRMYHSGDTADLSAAISWVKGLSRYASCHLAGFSLGGNLVLKYMGEAG